MCKGPVAGGAEPGPLCWSGECGGQWCRMAGRGKRGQLVLTYLLPALWPDLSVLKG